MNLLRTGVGISSLEVRRSVLGMSTAFSRSVSSAEPSFVPAPSTAATSAAAVADSDRPHTQNMYGIGKSLSASGLTAPQVDAIMETIEFLRNEGKVADTGFVTSLAHKADLAEVDLDCLGRVSELKHELSTLHHADYRDLRNEQTTFDAKTDKEMSFIKTDLALLEVRRNSTRELMEKNVEASLESLQSDLSKLENRVMRFSVGLLGTTTLVGLGVARLVA